MQVRGYELHRAIRSDEDSIFMRWWASQHVMAVAAPLLSKVTKLT